MARPIEFDRQQALEQAMELFWQQGYRATSVNDLVNLTGMQPGSLYAAFKSKKHLFMMVLQSYAEAWLGGAQQIFEDHHYSIEGIRQLFDSTVELVLSDEQHKGCLMVNTMQEMVNSDDDVRQFVTKAFADYEALFLKVLENAKAKGELRSQRNVQSLAAYLMSSICGIASMCPSCPDREKLTGIVYTTLSALEH